MRDFRYFCTIMNAILAIDSFKGCLTSREAEAAAAQAFGEDDDFVCIPVSDGGEGFSALLTEALGGTFRTVEASDPLGNPVRARYGLVRGGRTAIIETAAASGLTLVPPERRDPLHATSYGTGELIADALDEGVEEIFLGLGGSATVDGGIGMLQALGYRFITPYGFVVPGRAVCSDIIGVDDSTRHPRLRRVDFCGFYDVDVPFCGPGGAAELFAPQKGAGPGMVGVLEEWMQQVCAVMARYSGREVRTTPGAGAAGGIGGALHAFLHAEMTAGVTRFLDLVGMQVSLDMGYDTVITGEGRADRQTLRGKVPKGVLDYVSARSRVHPASVYLIAGEVADRELLREAGFADILQVTPPGAADALDRDRAATRITDAVRRLLAAGKEAEVLRE